MRKKEIDYKDKEDILEVLAISPYQLPNVMHQTQDPSIEEAQQVGFVSTHLSVEEVCQVTLRKNLHGNLKEDEHCLQCSEFCFHRDANSRNLFQSFNFKQSSAFKKLLTYTLKGEEDHVSPYRILGLYFTKVHEKNFFSPK